MLQDNLFPIKCKGQITVLLHTESQSSLLTQLTALQTCFSIPGASGLAHLLVGVFVGFQGLHDRQLGVVFKSCWLVSQNFP